MRLPILLALALAGCHPQQGAAHAPSDTPVAAQPASLGDALVVAARLHQALAEHRPVEAQGAMQELRRSLALAARSGSLEQQRRANTLDAAAIALQPEVEARSPKAMADSAALVRDLLAAVDTVAIASAGGGGGPAKRAASPIPRPAASPKPSFNEFDANQVLP